MNHTVKILALLGIVGLAACETVAGAGEDMQSAGAALERKSNEAQY